MSGIATLTSKFVRAVAGTKATILDTRKTAPGLRAIDKLAVQHGGGSNHRFGLDHIILIKDNHIDSAGSISDAIRVGKEGDNQLENEVEPKNNKQGQKAIEPEVQHSL